MARRRPLENQNGPVPSGTIYTCPMHPEIGRTRPGNCPICGMALEPVMPSLDEERQPRARRFPAPFLVDAAALGRRARARDVRPSRCARARPRLARWIELVLATPVVLWAGWPFFERWAQSIAHRNPNMWTLIGIGVGAAFVYSVVATVAPGLFPAGFRSTAAWASISRPPRSSSR